MPDNCCLISALLFASAHADEVAIRPANMPRIGIIDQRFQSYNIEMVEGDRRKFLEALWRETARSARGQAYEDGFGFVRIPAANRPDLRPAAKTRGRIVSSILPKPSVRGS
jgi:hypothetical protein